MQWCHGKDLISVTSDIRADGIAFTANAVITSVGRLVMGAGAARRVRDIFPGVDRILADAIRERVSCGKRSGVFPDYHLATARVVNPLWDSVDPLRVIAVQVKRDWRDRLDMASWKTPTRDDVPDTADDHPLWVLTRRSLEKLALLSASVPDKCIVLNCPLIGAAGFSGPCETHVRELVEDTLRTANVVVCTL